MTPAGQALLDQYPRAFHGAHLLRAICNAKGEEFVLLDTQLDLLQKNTIPSTAEEFLSLFEAELGISIDNPAMTLVERKDAVIAFMQRAAMTGSSWDWERVATTILGTGWSWSIGGTNNSELTVLSPDAAGTIRAELAEALLETITPATVLINVTYSEGFILDESLLDEDLL